MTYSVLKVPLNPNQPTNHRGVGCGGGGRCSMHHALRVSHLSRSLPFTPQHNAHVNRRRRC